MLSVEEMKKGCEFADGFEIILGSGLDVIMSIGNTYKTRFNLHELSSDELFTSIYYPLFLQRVIEGINNKGDFVIEINHWCLNVYNRHSFDLIKQFDFFAEIEDIAQAKEQAVKYILEKQERIWKSQTTYI